MLRLAGLILVPQPGSPESCDSGRWGQCKEGGAVEDMSECDQSYILFHPVLVPRAFQSLQGKSRGTDQ